MTYEISVGKVTGTFEVRGVSHDIVDWTEPVTYDGDYDDVLKEIQDVLAKHPEYTRAKIRPTSVKRRSGPNGKGIEW